MENLSVSAMQRLRDHLQGVLSRPDSKEAKRFAQMLRDKREEKEGKKDRNPKVTVMVPACESVGMIPVDPVLAAEEMLEEKIVPTNINILQATEGADGRPHETALCVPPPVAARLAPAAHVSQISIVKSLVERLARNPGSSIGLTPAEIRAVKRGEDGEDAFTNKEGVTISRVAHRLNLLVDTIKARIKKDPTFAAAVAASSKGASAPGVGSGSGSGSGEGAGPLAAVVTPEMMRKQALAAAEKASQALAAKLGVTAASKPSHVTIEALNDAQDLSSPTSLNSQTAVDKAMPELMRALDQDGAVDMLAGGASGVMSTRDAAVMLSQLADPDAEVAFDQVKELSATRKLTTLRQLAVMPGANAADATVAEQIAFHRAAASMWNDNTEESRFNVVACVATLAPFRGALAGLWADIDALRQKGSTAFPSLQASYRTFIHQVGSQLQRTWELALAPPETPNPRVLSPFTVRLLKRYTNGAATFSTSGAVTNVDAATALMAFAAADTARKAAFDKLQAVLATETSPAKKDEMLNIFGKQIALLVLASIMGFEKTVMGHVDSALRPWVAILFKEATALIEEGGLSITSDAAAACSADGGVFCGSLDADTVAAITTLGAATRPPVQLVHRFIQKRAIQMMRINHTLRLLSVKFSSLVAELSVEASGSTFMFTDLVGVMSRLVDAKQADVAVTTGRGLLNQAVRAVDAAVRATSDRTSTLANFALTIAPVPAFQASSGDRTPALVAAQVGSYNAFLSSMVSALACSFGVSSKFLADQPADGGEPLLLGIKVQFPMMPEHDSNGDAIEAAMTFPPEIEDIRCPPVAAGETEVESLATWQVVGGKGEGGRTAPMQHLARFLILLRGAFVKVKGKNESNWFSAAASPQAVKMVEEKVAYKGLIPGYDGMNKKPQGKAVAAVKLDMLRMLGMLISAAASGPLTQTFLSDLQVAIEVQLRRGDHDSMFHNKYLQFMRSMTVGDAALNSWRETMATTWLSGDAPTVNASQLGRLQTASSIEDALRLVEGVMRVLPPISNTGKLAEARTAVADMMRPLNLTEGMRDADGPVSAPTRKQVAQVWGWTQNFVDFHPLRRIGKAMLESFGGTYAAPCLASMLQLGPEDMLWDVVKGEFRIQITTAKGQAILHNATPNSSILAAQLKKFQPNLVLNALSTISHLTIGKAKVLASKVAHEKLRREFESELMSIATTAPLALAQPQAITDIFNVQDDKAAAATSAQWANLTNVAGYIVPKDVTDSLVELRAAVVQLWESGASEMGVIDASLRDAVQVYVKATRMKIMRMWRNKSITTRRKLNRLINEYGFAETLAQPKRLKAFVQACVTDEAWANLQGDGRLDTAIEGLHQGLLDEASGKYFKNRAINKPWAEIAAEYRAAFASTFAYMGDVAEEEVKMEIVLGEDRVTTVADMGTPTAYPNLDPRLVARGLLVQEDFSGHLFMFMPLTLVIAAVIGCSTLSGPPVGITEGQEAGQAPFLAVADKLRSATINSLLRSTTAGWLEVKGAEDMVNALGAADLPLGETFAPKTRGFKNTKSFIGSFPASMITSTRWLGLRSGETRRKKGWQAVNEAMASEVAFVFATSQAKKQTTGFLGSILRPLLDKNDTTLAKCAASIPLLTRLFFRAKCWIGNATFADRFDMDIVKNFVTADCKMTGECGEWWASHSADGGNLARLGRWAWGTM